MSKAIGIKVKKAIEEHDLGMSKFFGSPTIPNSWVDKWSDGIIFFCQIRLSDIALYDKKNYLPHKGYLYVFLDIRSYPYSPLVYFYDGEPDTVLDNFNDVEPEFDHLVDDWLITFEETDEKAEGIKLFGLPTDWQYEEKPNKLLMQFDPLFEDMGFLNYIDGYMYIFFGKDKKNFSDVQLMIEYS